jgi:hypothetical protein
MKKHAISLSLVGAVILASAVLPAASASAVAPAAATAATTGTVVLQFVSPSHKVVTALDNTASIDISGRVIDYLGYAQKKNTGDTAANGWVGPITKGRSVFHSVPANTPLYVDSYAPAGYAFPQVPDFKVAAGTVRTILVVAAKTATISGTLTTSAHKVLPHAYVAAVNSVGDVVADTRTNTTGKYTIHNLATGSYRVQFNARSTGSSGAPLSYTWNYWKGASRFSTGTPVAVHQQTVHASATAKTKINGVVPRGFTLSVLFSFTGTPDPQAQMYLVSTKYNAESIEVNLNSANTRAASRLAPGNYRIEVFREVPDTSPGAAQGDTTFEDLWYGGPGQPYVDDYSKSKAIAFTAKADVNLQFGSAPPPAP